MEKRKITTDELFDSLITVLINYERNKDILSETPHRRFLDLALVPVLLNKKENIFPLPLIVEGSIEYDNLKLLDKDEKWLMDNIKVPVSDIFYGFYKDESIYIIKQSELN